jgi:type IV pilus assembly protein PilC
MRVSPLRAELEAFQTDLSRGTPLKDALARRQLPPLYVRMVEIGARSNDLPGVLTVLADYFHRANSLWTRLKGLMVYPVIVISVALALTLLVSITFRNFVGRLFEQIGPPPPILIVSMWMPPVVLAMLAVFVAAALLNPNWRARLRWRLPAFHEASIAQVSSTIALMLRNGVTLSEALALTEGLEATTPAGQTLAQWRTLVENGQGKPAQWPATDRSFPPLFLWLVRQSGEDVAAGFQKAADVYHERAGYRIEMLLYGALPVSILLLGFMVFWQIGPLFRSLIWVMNMLGSAGGDGSS